MMMISKKRLGLDIQPQTQNQNTNANNIIRTIWYKEAIKQKKINSLQQYPPSPNTNKVCYVSYISFNNKNRYAYVVTNT